MTEIYNESLIHYALRNPLTLKYKSRLGTSGSLVNAQLYSSLTEAKRWSHGDYSQIRQVKVVDLGEINELP